MSYVCEFKEKKKKQKKRNTDKLGKLSCTFGQKWYFSAKFGGVQLSFYMDCAESDFQMYGENTNTIAIPIYRVLPYSVIKLLYVIL